MFGALSGEPCMWYECQVQFMWRDSVVATRLAHNQQTQVRFLLPQLNSERMPEGTTCYKRVSSNPCRSEFLNFLPKERSSKVRHLLRGSKAGIRANKSTTAEIEADAYNRLSCSGTENTATRCSEVVSRTAWDRQIRCSIHLT